MYNSTVFNYNWKNIYKERQEILIQCYSVTL